MARTMLLGVSGDRAWKDGEKFTAVFLGLMEEQINGDTAKILTFLDEKGENVQRWATTKWLQWIKGDKKKGQKPQIKEGDCLAVACGGEKKLKGGKRFRQFAAELLTGKDIPKSLRNV